MLLQKYPGNAELWSMFAKAEAEAHMSSRLRRSLASRCTEHPQCLVALLAHACVLSTLPASNVLVGVRPYPLSMAMPCHHAPTQSMLRSDVWSYNCSPATRLVPDEQIIAPACDLAECFCCIASKLSYGHSDPVRCIYAECAEHGNSTRCRPSAALPSPAQSLCLVRCLP